MEACFHLPSRAQRHRLRAALDQLHIAALPRTDDRGFWLDVLDWLSKYADHEPDWADGCLAVLSGRDASLKVWTYDREFRTTWRRPTGPRFQWPSGDAEPEPLGPSWIAPGGFRGRDDFVQLRPIPVSADS